MKVEVVVNERGVDVFTDGMFCGGITADRVSRGVDAVAEGVQCILLNVSEASGRPFKVERADAEKAAR